MTDIPREGEGLLDKYAVRLVPQVRERGDGTFEGSMPGMDWSATGDTPEDVVEKLLAEDLCRNDEDPYARLEQIESVIARHLKSPISGIHVLDVAEYDRIRRGPEADAELDRAFGDERADGWGWL